MRPGEFADHWAARRRSNLHHRGIHYSGVQCHTHSHPQWSFFEDLAPHFDGLPDHETEGLEKVTEADLEHQPYLTASDVGRVKYSVANWLPAAPCGHRG